MKMAGHEKIMIFVFGERYELRPDGLEKFREIYGARWRQDKLNWALADLIRRGLIRCRDRDGCDVTNETLQAIENTLKIIGITWDDVERLLGEPLS